ncbi:MAG: hypothetical protein RSB32_01865 [Mucinivorans sp.]
MDSEKIKEIWKTNAVKQIESYTDSEIKAIVLKSARQAIKYSYPSIIFWLLLILVNLLIVWLMMQYASPRLQVYGYVLMATIMVLLLGAICVCQWGCGKAQRYSFDMPLKEWIDLRIRYFDKSIEGSKKNWMLRYGLGLVTLLVFCLIYIFTMGFVLKVLLIQLGAGLIALVIAGSIANKIMIKRMLETRTQLQELLDQLQDSEPNK